MYDDGGHEHRRISESSKSGSRIKYVGRNGCGSCRAYAEVERTKELSQKLRRFVIGRECKRVRLGAGCSESEKTSNQ
jgi:hypothetical protein